MMPNLLLFSNHSSHWTSHSLLSWKLQNYPIHPLMFFTLLKQTWSLFYENHQSHLTYIFLYLPVCYNCSQATWNSLNWWSCVTGSCLCLHTVKHCEDTKKWVFNDKQTCSCISIYCSILVDIIWCWMHFFWGGGHNAVEMNLSVKAFNKSFGFGSNSVLWISHFSVFFMIWFCSWSTAWQLSKNSAFWSQ